MASRKRKIVAAAKEQLKNRKQDMLLELSSFVKEREELGNKEDEKFFALSEKIEHLFNEIKELESVLERKDKKSNNISWKDSDYKPAPSKKANNAKIVNEEAYRKSREHSSNIRSGPVAKWLTPGILVKKRGSEMVGLVMDIKPMYSTVLFGGCETIVRNLSLRPADWEK